MLGKKILAGILAVLILIKLTFLLISPGKWLVVSQAFLGHTGLVTVFYLVVLVLTGFFIFTRLGLIDVALVVLFTTTLVGLSLIPYAASMQEVGQEISRVGFGKAWLAWVIWVAIAVAVLYRIFSDRAAK